LVRPALQDNPRRSGGVLGPSLADNRPKTGKIRIPSCQRTAKNLRLVKLSTPAKVELRPRVSAWGALPSPQALRPAFGRPEGPLQVSEQIWLDKRSRFRSTPIVGTDPASGAMLRLFYAGYLVDRCTYEDISWVIGQASRVISGGIAALRAENLYPLRLL
jgi:hypothetical protein